MEQETTATQTQPEVQKNNDVESAETALPADGNLATEKPKATSRKKHAHCKKSPPKKSRKQDSSDSSSSTSSSDSDSDLSSSAADSDSSDDAEAIKKRKNKKARSRKLKKEPKKLKRRQLREEEEEADDDSDQADSEDEDPRMQLELLRQQQDKARMLNILKSMRQQQQQHEDPDELADIYAQLRNLGNASRGRNRKQSLDALKLSGLTRRDLDLEGARKLKEKQKRKSKPAKKKRASKVAFKRVDQLWDQSIHNYKLTETVEDEDTDEWDQYIFTVRRKFDWEHKYQETLVDIKSKPLKEALQHVMAGVKGVSLVADTPHVDPNQLFLYLEETRTYMGKLSEQSKAAKKKKVRRELATKAQHLKILIKYLDKDYTETKKTLLPMLNNKTISFDLLWALFKPNTIAYTNTYGDNEQPRAFKIEYVSKDSHFMKGTWYTIEGRYLEYDGKSFGMGSMSVQVPSFQGVRRIPTLDCYPLQYHRDPEALRTQLIERGKKFVALEGVHYKYHKGMAYTKRKRQILKININGRIMCDPAIHLRINPNYQISTVRPKEEDEEIFEISDDEDDSACGCCSSSDEAGGDGITPSSSEEASHQERRKYKVVRTPDGQIRTVEVEPNDEAQAISQGDRIEESVSRAFTEEELLIASPVVLGFAFSEKLWLEFTVSGISEVVFNVDAFDSLVLPEGQKSIVKALVSSHAFHPTKSIDDIISGKGRGLCCVLHGPPGTGKTLTAEGIADLLKCPLYMVSAGDLGTDPRNLEKELQNILDIAHSWGAILLLDEADVFLEKRSIHDIHRNALVSIFLRLLEYFQGILFLTTNRVETFDEAFVSRIHLSLRYEELSTKARHRVWKLFIEKVMKSEGLEVAKITDQDYMDLARRDVNGRQIKNLVRAAQALAVHEGKPLDMKHIKRVIDVAESFVRDLKGGSGYTDAMRSEC
ncbi:uncharacterized protein HMPREF1541_07413 [Cyphellophora europaea CBS 101466]|uniref:AAA+ ATPase domain-containing protein n=1 Tax=Cyphellophora europaea (strain CBS 101466) TaxID=1220924 RepID=W2RN76_CYPE1|nr:uncharacterized protein HMPREF1541_07413 [Cyphellophora europaea CBS 101466]ETN37790.1 hypothetical protein HMPREF1541_07413 [Cyphellophora europaea CBS 101466]